LEKVLDPKTFEQIKAILIGIWTGAFAAAGYAEFVAQLLLEWAARQGTWTWLVIKDALGLSETAEVAAAGGSTAGAIGLALLPLALLLLGGGLVLPASKLGKVGWDWEAGFAIPAKIVSPISATTMQTTEAIADRFRQEQLANRPWICSARLRHSSTTVPVSRSIVR